MAVLKNNTVKDTVKDTVNDTVNDSVTKDSKVLKLIISNPKITRKILAEKTGMSESTIAREIKRLRDISVIRRIGSDKTSHWEVEK